MEEKPEGEPGLELVALELDSDGLELDSDGLELEQVLVLVQQMIVRCIVCSIDT